jgi:hypothetical protein
MFTNGLGRIGLIALLFCEASPALATPITYTFSGTLDQAYNGSNQFSGSFTYDTDLPLYQGIGPIPGSS